ncbi:hypothetical protein F4805DRAFT_6783 [Annulohypoxylon moriforme]|nr:hypothetical protein F4805DRAFT_6783 [Annulohypoxylon moriforme]
MSVGTIPTRGVNSLPNPEESTQSILQWAASVKAWLDQVGHIRRMLYDDTLKIFACEGYENSVKFFSAMATNYVLRNTFTSFHVLEHTLCGRYHIMTSHMFRCHVTTARADEIWWPWKGDSVTEVLILSCKSHEVIVGLLLEHMPDIVHMDIAGRTALHIAAFQGHEALVKLLIKKGADIDAKDDSGDTALHIASSQGHDRMVQLLLDNKATIGIRNNSFRTALDVAIQKAATTLQSGHIENRWWTQAVRSDSETVGHTVSLLLENGAVSEGNYSSKTLEVLSKSFKSIGLRYPDNPIIFRRLLMVSISDPREMILNEHSIDFVKPPNGESVPNGMVDVEMQSDEDFASGGRSVRFGISLMQELLVHGHFKPVALIGVSWSHRWLFDSASAFPPIRAISIIKMSATFFRAVSIMKMSATFFRAVYITKLQISEGRFLFLRAAYIGTVSMSQGLFAVQAVASINTVQASRTTMNFYGETHIDVIDAYRTTMNFYGETHIYYPEIGTQTTINFYGETHIDTVLVSGTTMNFYGETHIDVIDASRMTMNFYGETRIGFVEQHTGSIVFFGTVDIKHVTIYEGFIHILKQADIKHLGVYNGIIYLTRSKIDTLVLQRTGSVNVLSPAQVKQATLYGGNMNFAYEICEEMMELFGEKGVTREEGNCEESVARIEDLKLYGGLFNFSVAGKIGTIETTSGIANFNVGMTVLHLAAAYGHEAIARLMLQRGANPNVLSRPEKLHIESGHQWENLKSEHAKSTPLHIAAFSGRKAIVQLLLEYQADVYIKDGNGKTALQVASSQGHMDIVRLLEWNGSTMGQIVTSVRNMFSLH